MLLACLIHHLQAAHHLSSAVACSIKKHLVILSCLIATCRQQSRLAGYLMLFASQSAGSSISRASA